MKPVHRQIAEYGLWVAWAGLLAVQFHDSKPWPEAIAFALLGLGAVLSIRAALAVWRRRHPRQQPYQREILELEERANAGDSGVLL